MTFADLQTLVDYHVWARGRMLDGLEALTPEQFTRDLGNSFKSIRDTVTRLRPFVGASGEAGVDRVIQYQLLSGQVGSSPFGHLLQHLVNHGSYHRGQVTTMLRQLGVAPPKSMDLLFYYREKTI